MTVCDSCPHDEHEFSSCFEWPNCDCNKRKPVFCDNSLGRKQFEEIQLAKKVPNRKDRRKNARRI